MEKSKIYVGVEIGTSKTCMVVGEVKPDNSVKILGVGSTKSAGVRKGEIVDMAQVRECVRGALLDAEDICDVEIQGVFLAVTGAHIQGVNNRGTFRLPDKENAVREQHVEEVNEIAKDVVIPSDHSVMLDIPRTYWLDGDECASVPVGLHGRTLEAEFHIIHGVKTRLQNSVRCIREIPLEVEDVVFAPIATAQIALTLADKEKGALVIDIGGGTTDYVLYLDGAPIASGCIPVGGDHVTNDLHLIAKIPLSKAEKVKKMEGNVSGDPARSVGTVTIPDEKGFPEIEIERSLLNDVMRGRLEEALRLVKDRLPKGSLSKVGTGVFLTGGTSLTAGFSELASEVFGLQVYRPEKPAVSGIHESFKDPQYSTAVGLIRYAQIMDADGPRRQIKGLGLLRRLVERMKK